MYSTMNTDTYLFIHSPFIVRDREVKRREDSNSAQWGNPGKSLKKNLQHAKMSLPSLLFPSWSSKPGKRSESPDIGECYEKSIILDLFFTQSIEKRFRRHFENLLYFSGRRTFFW